MFGHALKPLSIHGQAREHADFTALRAQ